ncbi:choline-binding transcriptional repressor BetI [Prosthecomicrobium sp. N25]|uniref:choline-binding transcriptional repressor BetI n=1 Tax=Prosthecomicrobium sp. N25 TaxID=3129254 RepID=UPI0030779237
MPEAILDARPGRPRPNARLDRRRAELIEATIGSIADVGFQATTVAAIAGRAGVSVGLVAFYFGDKDGVLEATLRHLAGQLRDVSVARLAAARTPRDRIAAVIDSALGDAQFERRIATVWLAFWGQVPATPRFRRVQRAYERRMLSTLTHAFAALVSRPEALRLARATAALIDGLWLRATLSSDPPDAAEARSIVQGFVDTQIALLDLALLKRTSP